MELQVPMQMGSDKTDLWVVVAMPIAHKLATSLADEAAYHGIHVRLRMNVLGCVCTAHIELEANPHEAMVW